MFVAFNVPSASHVACDKSVYQSRTVFRQLSEIFIKANCINTRNQYKYNGINAEQGFSNIYFVMPFIFSWSIDDNVIVILVIM